MYAQRIKRLLRCCTLLLILLGCGLAYRIVIQGEELTATAYVEEQHIERLREAAELGLIYGDKGKTVIDSAGLEREFSRGLARFAESHREYLSISEDGSLLVNETGFRVANRRILRGAGLANRGRILDRNGKVLAETITAADGSYSRSYSFGASTFPLVGVAHPLYGKKGIERDLDRPLSGEQDSTLAASLYRFFSGRSKNADVELTIDAGLQQTLYNEMEQAGQSGAAVIIDIASGELLAAVSTPSFDPATPAGGAWKSASAAGARSPFINKALSRRFPPGSTFKLVVASSWMDRDGYDEKWGLRCTGRHPRLPISDHNKQGHGWVSISTAVITSCNVFFSDIGVQLGRELLLTANRFGFNMPSRLTAGNLQSVRSLAFAGYRPVSSGKEWRAVDFSRNSGLVAQGSIGQNVVMASPLQMALVIGAIGNDGKRLVPELVRGAWNKADDGSAGFINIWPEREDEAPPRACSRKTARAIREMLKKVMTNGTGYAIPKLFKEDGSYRLSALLPTGRQTELIGKTGTAQTGDGREDHAWFIGLAPVDNPRFAISVLVEHGGYGSKAAGPLAARAAMLALNAEIE